jgi:hypothetical protein
MDKSSIRKACAIVAISVVGAAQSAATYAEDALGRASCHRDTPGSDCAAAWDFSSMPRSFFFVERFEFDQEKSGWRRVEGPVEGEKGVSTSLVSGGYLYRVAGCDDKAGTIDCVGSTVFWAPARPFNLDDIPDVVRTPEGYYLRDRHHSREFQIIDYNMALMSQLVETVDMGSMPPMTDLQFSDLGSLPAGISDEDATLDFNVHLRYPLH